MHDLMQIIEDNGYQELRYVEGVGWCAILQYLYTVGVFLDLDKGGPAQGRYCFDEWSDASHFLKHWDGIAEPVVGENGCKAIKRFHLSKS